MTVGIRGMGLIGGSFEKALSALGHTVLNLRNDAALKLPKCDIVIVALPPSMVSPWVKENAVFFGKGAIVFDVSGVKSEICASLKEFSLLSDWVFVGGHPMAGKEVSGYENSDAELFRGASMILTPYPETDHEVISRLKKLFGEIGFAKTVVTDPARHDQMIAYTSQLAHVVSSAYVRDELSEFHDGFSAGSYQDMTRVATVDPDLWTDLFLSNSEALDLVLSRLIGRLFEYRDAINSSDAVKLKRLLQEGRDSKIKAK